MPVRAALSAAALCAHGADATSYTWRGIIDNQWTTPKNWEPATTAAGPGDSPSDVVIIDDNEGKNADVQLTQPKSIAQLNMGDKLGVHAKLTLLNQLTVSQSVSVQPNGILQLNAGLAAVSCPNVDVQGKLQFYSGLLTGNYKVHGPGKADFGSADYQGAKVFDAAAVDITTAANVNMGGSIQFGSNAVITATSGIDASGQNFQMVLQNATTGKGNSYTSPGFNWTQGAPQVALTDAVAAPKKCTVEFTNNAKKAVTMCMRENGGVPGAAGNHTLAPGASWSMPCRSTAGGASVQTYFADDWTQCGWDLCPPPLVNTGSCRHYPFQMGEGVSAANGNWYGSIGWNWDGAGQGFLGKMASVGYGVRLQCSSYNATQQVDVACGADGCTPSNKPNYGRPNSGVVECDAAQALKVTLI